METKLGYQYEVARIFIDEIIPYSLEYYFDCHDPVDEIQED